MFAVLRLILICYLAAQPLAECRAVECAPIRAACCCESASDDGQLFCSCCEQSGSAPAAPSPKAPDLTRSFSALPLWSAAIVLPIPVRMVRSSAAPVQTGSTARDIRVKLCVWLT